MSARSSFATLPARAACRAAMVLAFIFVAAGGAAAEAGYSSDTTPGRLPKTVVPTHYAIELEPNLESLTRAGSAVLDPEGHTPAAPPLPRPILPCWGELAFKATFALTVTVPRTFLVVGNMPIAREEPVTPTLKQVAFAATPVMSSYLFVLTAGELERMSAQADGVTVGVVTTLGKREQGRFALERAVDLLRYFNDYFGVKYPLPKLDLIAVPGGFGGAMENWGAITFFESRLLFDPASSAPSARRGIFIILAHEMAHQWFGNLVTMGKNDEDA